MTQHTPGPWYSWLPNGCDSGCRTIRTEKGRTQGGYRGTEIASTFGLADDDEDAANARLLAAAPDLLAALEQLCDACDQHAQDGNPFRDARYPQMEKARVTIAKVRKP